MKQKALLNGKHQILSAIILVATIIVVSIFFLERNGSESESISNTTLYTFESTNLPKLETAHYDLWGIGEDGSRNLLKRFGISSEGEFFTLDLTSLESIRIEGEKIYEEYEISIEKNGDRDEFQSSCILLSGERVDSQIHLNPYKTELSNISGEFILATPTDGTSNTNEKSGVWISQDLKENSLNLPELEPCFIWSAYLNYRGEMLRIGSFSNTNGSDTFSEYSLPQFAPPVIGEDFLKNMPNGIEPPINIAGASNSLIISLDVAQISVFKDFRPFFAVLEYNFSGIEQERTGYSLLKASDNPFASISVEYTE